MKKLIALILSAMLGATLVTTTASADVAKGQKLFIKKLKKVVDLQVEIWLKNILKQSGKVFKMQEN